MKIKLLTVLALGMCASAFGAVSSFPLPGAVNVFGVGTTNSQVSPSYAVVSSRSANGGAPVVTFINAGSDLASSKITFYTINAALQVTFTNSTTTLFVQNTNNSSANWQSGTVIIRHIVNDSYEKRALTSNTGATNIVLTVAPLGTTVPGDMVYFATAGPFIALGAATNNIGNGAGPIFAGQKGLPLLLEVTLTSNGGLFSAGGYYSN